MSRSLFVALALVLMGAAGCDRDRALPPESAAPEAPSAAVQPESRQEGAGLIESPPEVGQTWESPGGPTEALDIGVATDVEDLPEGWPPELPHPPGLIFTRMTPEDEPLVYIEATHPAPHADLLAWWVSHLSDQGWLVLQRDRLGASSRVRLARDRARWLLVVGSATDESGERRTWVNIRRQLNEPPIGSLLGAAGASDCTAALPRTPSRPAVWCELRLGPPIAGVPLQGEQPDAALGRHNTGLLFVSGRELMLVSLADQGVERGPTVLSELDPDTSPQSAPQVLAGVDEGWLVSWIAGDPGERLAGHYDAGLRRTGRHLRLSDGLGLLDDAAWVPLSVDRDREYAAAWTERHGEGLAFRVARVQRDADRIRRSGLLPVRGAPPEVGPALVHDGAHSLGLVWGSVDGVMFRAVGTDGLPDHPERRLEPGQPDWVGAVFAAESYWILWSTGRRGFWIRVDPEGCVDNARGSLGGLPAQAWSGNLGPVAQVRHEGEIRLVRLADTGEDEPRRSPEVIGTSRLRIDWSDLEPTDDGFAGIAHTDAGYAMARWVCE